uniref:Uncharacterized protein n=1 Tax=Neobodo designis TaxID=312471 RepID=A0A7S1L874_NEODS
MRNHKDDYALHKPAPPPPVAKFAERARSARHLHVNGPGAASMRKKPARPSEMCADSPLRKLLRPAPPPQFSATTAAGSPHSCRVESEPIPTADEAARATATAPLSRSLSAIRFQQPALHDSRGAAQLHAPAFPVEQRRQGVVERHIASLCTLNDDAAVVRNEKNESASRNEVDAFRESLYSAFIAEEERLAARAKPRFRTAALRCPNGFGTPPGEHDEEFLTALREDELAHAQRLRRLDEAKEMQHKLARARASRRRTRELSRVSFEKLVALGIPHAMAQLRRIVVAAHGEENAPALVDHVADLLRRKHGVILGSNNPTPRERRRSQLLSFDVRSKRPVHERLISAGTQQVLQELQRLPKAPRPSLSCHDADDLDAATWLEAQLEALDDAVALDDSASR